MVPKGSSDLSDIESGVLSMYARGMSRRDVAAAVREVYGFSMSAEASVWSLFSCGSAVRKVMCTTNAVESVNASLRKVVRRGCFPDEDAVMKLMHLRVRELYRSWGEGCHQAGWSQVRSQLLCDEGIRPRIERYL